MLLAEYDYDVDIAVQREEEREIALKEGEAKGFSVGVAQGEAKGFSLGIIQGEAKGSYQAKLETVKNLLGLGMPIETIAQVTGLFEAEIESL